MPEQSATVLDTRTVHEGPVFTASQNRVRLPNGRETTMDVVRHPPSVILLPMPDDEQVVLVRQYRFAIDDWIWELPAGSVDPGEELESAARRECHEEIGEIPTRIERLGALYPTPGYCDELMVFFKLSGLTAPATPAQPDEDEILEPRVFSVRDAQALVRDGVIRDMKTAVGLSMIEEKGYWTVP